jgi:antitoxin MazE
MKMTTQVSRWGNSLGVRLPKAVAGEVQLGEGDTVQLSVDNGAIVIRPSAAAGLDPCGIFREE